MKKTFLAITILFLSALAHAQVKEEAVERIMKHRIYPCFEVEYNSILLIQDMYEMNRLDTFDAVINFWKHHCEMNERLFSLSILNSIRNNRFKEFLSSKEFLTPRLSEPVRSDSDMYPKKVLSMLAEYKTAASGSFSNDPYYAWWNENYPLPRNIEEYYAFYEGYYDFLRYMARSLAGKRDYSPVEQFYLRFYASPDSVRFAELDSVTYEGTILQKQYKGFVKYDKQVHGTSYGLQAGAWIPYDRLALFGNHSYYAAHVGGKSYTTAWDMVLGFRAGPSANAFTVRSNDTLYSSTKFTGWYIGIEMAHKLWQRKKHQFDFIWGLGYEGIRNLSVDTDTATTTDDLVTNEMGSGYVNAGLAYRFYVRNRITSTGNRKHSYLSLQARYYIADFGNPGGTDLHGNYLTIGLVYGAYSHNYSKYPRLR